MNFLTATESAESAAITFPHMLELILALGTIGLAIATAVLIRATNKLARVTAAEAGKLANNSIDSMENVAVTAINHEAHTRRIRELRKIAAQRRNHV